MSFIATSIACIVGFLEYYSICVVRDKFDAARVMYEGRNPAKEFVDELDAYLMEKENPEDPESPSVLEAYAEVMGQAMFQAGKFSAMQAKSVDARTQNKYDTMVREGIQSKMPPRLKLLQKALDYLDMDIDVMDIMNAGELPVLQNSMRKFGLEKLLSNDGGQGTREGVM